MKNCILKGLCVFFILTTLLMALIPVALAQSGHGGDTEVIARIESQTEETQPLPTAPPAEESGKLRITASRSSSASMREQSFVYTVTGPESTRLTVAIVLESTEASDSVVLSGLPQGDYQVTELHPWSWRCNDGQTQSAAVGDALVTVVFDHSQYNPEWLNDYSHRYA